VPRKVRNWHNFGIEKQDNYAEKSQNPAEQVMTLFLGYLPFPKKDIPALHIIHYVASKKEGMTMKCHICKSDAYGKQVTIVHESESRKHPLKNLVIYLCAEHLHELLAICIRYSDFEERDKLVRAIRDMKE